jgi:tRNA(fMet)-specific endonuclease VapC
MVIDTGLFIEFLRTGNKKNTTLYSLDDKIPHSISSVTIFELYMGATNAEKANDILLLTRGLAILPFNKEVAVKAGKIYLQLRKENKLIEFRDIFIAATCLVHKLTLVTLNLKHFERVEGLAIWK